jgi:hypothetical protein
MTLSSAKLRAVVNLLADPLQVHAAAHVLAEEAKARGVLVSDLIAGILAPTPPPPSAPEFSDVADSIDTTIISKDQSRRLRLARRNPRPNPQGLAHPGAVGRRGLAPQKPGRAPWRRRNWLGNPHFSGVAGREKEPRLSEAAGRWAA